MRWMNIFKKTARKKNINQKKPLSKAEVPKEGDWEKTKQLRQLIPVRLKERDESWKNQFLEALPQASFCGGDPEVLKGPDGFSYHQLHLPPPETTYKPQVIVHLLNQLLESGKGIVINPVGHEADWVLSYGDLLNYQMTGVFYHLGETTFSSQEESETISQEDEVSVTRLEKKLLPKKVRGHLRQLLNDKGIKQPKILLMQREHPEKKIRQDLIFNFTSGDFKNRKQYEKTLTAIRWYLPQHYSFAFVEEDSLPPVFLPL